MCHKETAKEFRRRRAVELMNQGWPRTVVAQILEVAINTLYKWRKLDRLGTQTPKRRRGPHRRLTDEQLTELEKLLLRGAAAHGWPNDLWTAKRVAKLIRKQFGVSYHPGSAYRILTTYMGWTPQRPSRQLRDRDEQEIERWLKEEYPRILERAERRHAYLVFIDESGFLLAPHLRRTYAPRGKQPVIKTSDPHARISAIGAITISPERHRFGFQFLLSEDNENFHGYSIVPFIDALRQRIAGRFTIIWDGILIHTAKALADYLSRHRDIVVESFPAESSELNPVDNVWGYVKYGRLPNYTPPDLKELRRRIKREFTRLQGRPNLLEAFFRRTGLTLDPREPIKVTWREDGRLIVGEHAKKRGVWPS